MSESYRRASIVLAVSFAAVITTGHVLHARRATPDSPGTVNMIWGDIFLALIVVIFRYNGDRRVTLFEDAIELSDWFSVRRLTRDQIKARRIRLGGRGTWHHVLIPADSGQRLMQLPASLDTDQTFTEWLRPIPRLRQPRRHFFFRRR